MDDKKDIFNGNELVTVIEQLFDYYEQPATDKKSCEKTKNLFLYLKAQLEKREKNKIVLMSGSDFDTLYNCILRHIDAIIESCNKDDT